MMTPGELIEQAFACHRAGEIDTAEALYRQVLRIDARDLNALQLLGALLGCGDRAAEGVLLLERARAELQTRDVESGQHATLFYNLGNALRHVGRHAEAIASYRHGIALAPELPEIHARLAAELFAQGDFAAAVAGFERVLALRPEDHEAYYMLGRILRSEGETERAEAAYRRALTFKPDLVDALFHLGVLLQSNQQRQLEAIALYERVIAIAPDYAEVYASLGTACRNLMQIDRALSAFQRYLNLAPDSAVAHFHLGRTLVAAGRIGDAIGYLERASSLDQSRSLTHSAHMLRGDALQSLGRTEEALVAFRQALEHGPVLTYALKRKPKFSVLLLLAPGAYNTPYEYLVQQEDYDVKLVLLVPGFEHDVALLRSCGDVVVNLISDADRDRPILPAAAALIDGLAKPVINHPVSVMATDREGIATLLSEIPGCRVANTRRHAGTAMLLADARLPPLPFLARRAGFHNGDEFVAVERDVELQSFVARDLTADYYVIEYLDYRSADGFFRKYRFFFVDDAILPYHLAIGSDWKVHHVKTDMASHDWMKQEEEAFLRDPARVFNPNQMATLRAIRSAVGLEFFGVDCAIDREGKVVVFEANATMLVHDNNPAFPYRNGYVRRIKSAFNDMLLRCCAAAAAVRALRRQPPIKAPSPHAR
jgi:tetratricopeptide (TPR) repeat protein